MNISLILMTEPSTVLTMSIFLPNLDDAFIQSDVQLRQDTIEQFRERCLAQEPNSGSLGML